MLAGVAARGYGGSEVPLFPGQLREFLPIIADGSPVDEA